MNDEYKLVLREPGEENIFWCGYCQCWVKRSELKKWTGDDMLHYLCPGCDADILEPQRMEE